MRHLYNGENYEFKQEYCTILAYIVSFPDHTSSALLPRGSIGLGSVAEEVWSVSETSTMCSLLVLEQLV